MTESEIARVAAAGPLTKEKISGSSVMSMFQLFFNSDAMQKSRQKRQRIRCRPRFAWHIAERVCECVCVCECVSV